MNDPTTVYVYRDATGTCLYVGITSQGIGRSHQHAESSQWWQYASTCELIHVEDRHAAEKMERHLIKHYRPIFNKQHNPDWYALMSAYLAVRQRDWLNITMHQGDATFDVGDDRVRQRLVKMMNDPARLKIHGGVCRRISQQTDHRFRVWTSLEHDGPARLMWRGVATRRVTDVTIVPR